MRKVYAIAVAICTVVLAGCNSQEPHSENTTTTEVTTEATTEATTETTSMEESSENASKDIVTEEGEAGYRDPEIARIYREVLKSERPFISVEEGNKETYLEDYNYYRGSNIEYLEKKTFSFRDINDDGNYEIIVDTGPVDCYNGDIEILILYCEDGQVYGYRLPSWMKVTGDNIILWYSIDYPGVNVSPYYVEPIEIKIEDKELKYKYIFKEKGSEEEQWLRDKGILTEENIVRYVGDEYEKYRHPKRKRRYGYSLTPENIDTYVR